MDLVRHMQPVVCEESEIEADAMQLHGGSGVGMTNSHEHTGMDSREH